MDAIGEQTETFEVIVTGFEPRDETPEVRLQRVFGIDDAVASKLLTRLPATVQRRVPRVRAEYFRRALTLIGAAVEVRDAAGELVAPQLPSSVPPPPSRSAPPAAPALTPAELPVAMPAERTAIEALSTAMKLRSATADTLVDTRPRPSSVDAPWVPPASALLPAGYDPAQPHLGTQAKAEPARPAEPTVFGDLSRPRAIPSAPPRPPSAAPMSDEAAIRRGAHPTVREPVPGAPSVAPASAWQPPALHVDPVLPVPASSGLAAYGGIAGLDPRSTALLDAPAGAAKVSAAQSLPAPAPQARAPALGMLGDLELPSLDLALPPPKPVGAALPSPTPPAQRGGKTAITLDDQPTDDFAVSRFETPAATDSEPPPRRGRSPRAAVRRERARRPANADPASAPADEGQRADPTGASTLHDPRKPSVADRRTFWQALPDGLALPFAGHGVYWVAVIGVWSVAVSVLVTLCKFVPLLGASVAFFANTSLLAFTADYFRVCFWVAAVSEKRIDRAPEIDPTRLLHIYVRSGAHLTVFALVSQVPLIYFVIDTLGDGNTVLDLLADPVTWLLAILPGYLWPAAVMLTALNNDFGAIWNVPAAVRVVLRVPAEYTVAMLIGAFAFASTWGVLLLFGKLFGVTGVLLSGTLGFPLAISHGVLGSLLGHLARARADAFE